MSRIFDGISAFLREEFKADDWKKDEDGDQTIAFLLEDDNGRQWDGAVLIDEDNHRLVFYSTMLESAKKKVRPQVMEFITRANYALPIGNWELDLDDGEICFKTAIDLEKVELTSQMCHNLIDTNLTITGVYFDALHAVLKGEASPVDAIASVEDGDAD